MVIGKDTRSAMQSGIYFGTVGQVEHILAGIERELGVHPKVIATGGTARYLGERGIFTWDGNYYALNLTERLGVESSGGMLRIAPFTIEVK